jgi:hypothetical protein
LLAGSSNLIWNNSLSRLGIGTTTPAAAFDVYGVISAAANRSLLSREYPGGGA